MGKVSITALILAFLFAANASALTVDNALQIRKAIGLSESITPPRRFQKLKVAIFDNGFQGYSAENNSELPSCTQFVEGAGNPQSLSPHGLRLAEVFYQTLNPTLSSLETCAPKIYLVNTNGFTNLKSAIDFAVDEKIDVVVYATNWEYGGNFDGRGFINQEIKRATDAGIIWINAAGDYRGLVYEDSIELNEGNNVLTLHPIKNNRVIDKSKIDFENKLDQNSFKIVLSWNDFEDVESYSTIDDLDIEILNENGDAIAEGTRNQSGDPNDAMSDESFSSHAREIITLGPLARGTYSVQISAKFRPIRSTSFRVALVPDKFGSLEWLDSRPSSEIMVPADMEDVITVGDNSPVSAYGKTADGRIKPDFTLPLGQIEFSDGSRPFGTSFAAAAFASVVVELKSKNPSLTANALRTYIGKLKLEANQPGALQLTSYEAVKAAFGGIEMRNLPQDSSFAVGRNAITGIQQYYVLADSDPKLISPFISYPNSAWTSTATHIYLMNQFRHVIDIKANDARYGPEYLRFLNRNEALLYDPSSRGVPVWKMPNSDI